MARPAPDKTHMLIAPVTLLLFSSNSNNSLKIR